MLFASSWTKYVKNFGQFVRVLSLVFGVASNLTAVNSGVPRLDGLHAGSSCECNQQFCIFNVATPHLFIGSGYRCPHPVLDDPAMLLCMSQTAFPKTNSRFDPLNDQILGKNRYILVSFISHGKVGR